MSTTYRGRLDVVLGLPALSICNHGLNVVAFYLVGRMLFPEMTDDTRPALPDGSLDALHHGRALPFGALGLSEEVGATALQAGGAPQRRRWR